MTQGTCLTCGKEVTECFCQLVMTIPSTLAVSHDTIEYPVTINRENLTEEEEVYRDKFGRDEDEIYEDYKETNLN